jgi:hypothetical protein
MPVARRNRPDPREVPATANDPSVSNFIVNALLPNVSVRDAIVTIVETLPLLAMLVKRPSRRLVPRTQMRSSRNSIGYRNNRDTIWDVGAESQSVSRSIARYALCLFSKLV